jgi:NAD(P)H dehydrogenase (quinone)
MNDGRSEHKLKISVILGHPYPKSFNHAIAVTVVNTLKNAGHQVLFHDLGAEGFDPVIQAVELAEDRAGDQLVEQHCREIRVAEGIIVIHPNWWGQPPAILKGWVDRVLRPGVAYAFEAGDSGGGVPVGLLRAEAALVFNTANTPAEREDAVFGDPLETIWRNCIFHFCGVSRFCRKIYRVVADSTCAERQEWLEETRRTVDEYFPGEN